VIADCKGSNLIELSEVIEPNYSTGLLIWVYSLFWRRLLVMKVSLQSSIRRWPEKLIVLDRRSSEWISCEPLKEFILPVRIPRVAAAHLGLL